MLSLRQRLAVGLAALGLLVGGLFATGSVLGPGSAEARCNGVGNEVTSTYIYNGTTRAVDEPRNGTCNDNNTYNGNLRDATNDGYCVQVQFSDAGQGWAQAPGGYTCSTGAGSDFHWTDLNGTREANERLCMVGHSCGWGSAFNGWGPNHGY